MAKPTHHSALESMGFKLVNSEDFSGDNDKIGTSTTHHYTATRNSVGGKIVRPITHHVFVDEFSRTPGKYNAFYAVTQRGLPYAQGDFDTFRSHKDNVHRGSRDPIKDIMYHHQGIVGTFNREKAPPLQDVTPDNLNRLVNGPYHTTPGWDSSDPEMKAQRFIVRGPDRNPLTYLNSTQDWSEKPRVYMAGINKRADEFDDIVGGNSFAGPCWVCGKATYNRPEGRSLQSDSSSPVNASEETGGDMHGPDINLCGDCATNSENNHMAVTHGSRGPGRIWHYNDQGVPGCPECESHLMDQADEDLRP